ncbi:hypothetical protein PIIN_10678 [Serendipita indica DSM 11827]|uniref:Uncharacterized protein n=1 Tax=Serendipita indica (strain DSM 11827) TaxID=1109443 RepID=G4TZE7_SERID|nr:hypothetical protein PIIN_10678 [Serendipita indica DSM 11827]
MVADLWTRQFGVCKRLLKESKAGHMRCEKGVPFICDIVNSDAWDARIKKCFLASAWGRRIQSESLCTAEAEGRGTMRPDLTGLASHPTRPRFATLYTGLASHLTRPRINGINTSTRVDERVDQNTAALALIGGETRGSE